MDSNYHHDLVVVFEISEGVIICIELLYSYFLLGIPGCEV